MGSEMHAWIEATDRYGCTWLRATIGYIPRSYVLFCAMCGARDEGLVLPVASMRGLPIDATNVVRADHDSFREEWSWSWLTLPECEEADRRVRAVKYVGDHIPMSDRRSGLEPMIAMMREIERDGERARLVFCVD